MDRKERILKLSAISKELWKYFAFYLRDEKLSDDMWQDMFGRLAKFSERYKGTEFEIYVDSYIKAMECYLVEIERAKNA
ncbi:MAG: hypothetical protein K6F00_11035 [Lachnospiraceae bacterium]|nr:hypothetical protein [Lachnospiraceae bacterium]